MKISQNNIIILSIIVFDISHVDSQLISRIIGLYKLCAISMALIVMKIE